MSSPTLDSVLSAKEKLEEELRELQEQETALRRKAAEDAFSEVMKLLGQFCSQFTSKQRAEIVAAVREKAPSKPKKTAAGEVVPNTGFPIPAKPGAAGGGCHAPSRRMKARLRTSSGRPRIRMIGFRSSPADWSGR